MSPDKKKDVIPEDLDPPASTKVMGLTRDQAQEALTKANFPPDLGEKILSKFHERCCVLTANEHSGGDGTCRAQI